MGCFISKPANRSITKNPFISKEVTHQGLPEYRSHSNRESQLRGSRPTTVTGQREVVKKTTRNDFLYLGDFPSYHSGYSSSSLPLSESAFSQDTIPLPTGQTSTEAFVASRNEQIFDLPRSAVNDPNSIEKMPINDVEASGAAVSSSVDVATFVAAATALEAGAAATTVEATAATAVEATAATAVEATTATAVEAAAATALEAGAADAAAEETSVVFEACFACFSS